MKIEIDLNDIMSDSDYGSETLQDSIRRQIIANLTETVKNGLADKIDNEIGKIITEEVKKGAQAVIPKIADELIVMEYTPVDEYGREKKPTTFKDQLILHIVGQMTYKKPGYGESRNYFTDMVDTFCAEQVKKFKLEFDKEVNRAFVTEAFEYARKTLTEKLGIK